MLKNTNLLYGKLSIKLKQVQNWRMVSQLTYNIKFHPIFLGGGGLKSTPHTRKQFLQEKNFKQNFWP